MPNKIRYQKYKESIKKASLKYYYKHRKEISKRVKKNYYRFKERIKIYNKKYRTNHKEYFRIKYKEWVITNPEKRKRTTKNYQNSLKAKNSRKEYYKQNQKILAEKHRQWRKNNPEKAMVRWWRRRALKLKATGSFTAYQWQELKRKFGYTCPICKRKEPIIKLSIDHIIPLSRGGTNDITNIQPLCLRCNSVKRDNIIICQPIFVQGAVK